MNTENRANNPAFARYNQDTINTVDPRQNQTNPNTKHYLWYPGEDIPHPEVPGGFIMRGAVTPVLNLPVWDSVGSVPAEMRVRTRNGADGKVAEAMYMIPPEPIFRTITDQYGDWGVTELTAIKDGDPKKIDALDIDGTFFPHGVPVTYDEMEAQINLVVGELQNGANAQLWSGIAKDMLKAIRNSRRFDNNLVDETEGNIERSKTDKNYQSTYDERALRALERLNRERKDTALIASTARSSAIMEALPQLLSTLANGQAQPQQNALTPELFAEGIALALEKLEARKPQAAPQPAQNNKRN